MSVYVDDMRPVTNKRRNWRYPDHCHMLADTDAELEAMAKRLQLDKSWRHGDHYDLTWGKRIRAIWCGAIPLSTREMDQ